ncbi:hypothetical protein IJJ12_02680, partial [bacterium]|nr:hypothetical protein [bacterium]
ISPKFAKFTDNLLTQFKFNDGFMINAGEFQGTSSSWGIIFSNFENKIEISAPQTHFTFNVMHSNTGTPQTFATHTLQRVPNDQTISTWLKEIPVPKEEFNNGRYPRILGGFNISSGKTISGYLRKNAIGFMHNGSSNVQFSDKYTNLNTAMNYVDHGVSVTKDNFERICVTFACRKSILPEASWINDKDVFRRPSNEFQQSTAWPEFVHDCVVYSLFHKSSFQTSLRNFEYQGEYYDVPNEWFFMSRQDSIKLGEQYQLNDLVFEARNSAERYVYTYLYPQQQLIVLSQEAQDLLIAGQDFIRTCFAKRYMTSQDHPEWHLLTWDAGFLQSYKIYTVNRHDEKICQAYHKLEKVRTILETKIRCQVYADHILAK